MLTKTLLVVAAASLVPLGCSGGAHELRDAGTGGMSAGGSGARGDAGAGTAGTGGNSGVAGAAGAPDGGSDAGGGDAGIDTTGVAGAAGAPDGGSDAGGTAGAQDDGDALIVPSGLPVSLEPGGDGALNLFALTLRDGPDGLVIDAALNDDGDGLVCSAALKIYLYDTNDQPLADFIGGLDTTRFYSYALPDGSTTIAGCASLGDITMSEIDTKVSDLKVSDVGSVVYYYAYWALDAVLIDGPTVSEVNSVTTDAGTSYTGTVVNGFDVPLNGPEIAVFALNRVGRPLGLATGGDSSQVPPGGSWTFQTTTVDAPGIAGYAAYPAGSVGN